MNEMTINRLVFTPGKWSLCRTLARPLCAAVRRWRLAQSRDRLAIMGDLDLADLGLTRAEIQFVRRRAEA